MGTGSLEPVPIAEMANSSMPVVEARGGSCSHRRKEDHFHLVSGASIASISSPAINPQIYFCFSL